MFPKQKYYCCYLKINYKDNLQNLNPLNRCRRVVWNQRHYISQQRYSMNRNLAKEMVNMLQGYLDNLCPDNRQQYTCSLDCHRLQHQTITMHVWKKSMWRK